ncbi:hypothetical protein ACVISU_005384 [Bradyrhizobium sp. USDA 4452]
MGTPIPVLQQCRLASVPVSPLYPRNRQPSPRVRVFINDVMRAFARSRSKAGTTAASTTLSRRHRRNEAMRTFFGMILGALLLVCGVYVYDSMRTSSVANGEVAQDTRTIVNWDVAAHDWNLLKTRTREQWDKIASK